MIVYQASENETLLVIAKKYNIDVASLLNINEHIEHEHSALHGTSIYIPDNPLNLLICPSEMIAIHFMENILLKQKLV